MFERREIKRAAGLVVRRAYLRGVAVCLLLYVLVGAYGFTFAGGGSGFGGGGIAQGVSGLPVAAGGAIAGIVSESGFSSAAVRGSNTEVVNAFSRNFASGGDAALAGATAFTRATDGILAAVFDNVTQSGSFIFGTLNALNQFIFRDRVLAGVIILVGAAATFLYWMFVGNVLRVGECRFFLEKCAYPKTRVARVLFVYKIRRTGAVARAMALRSLLHALWSLTVAGCFVKYYSYRMVPYLLAENPNLTARAALRLSRRMMSGHKWRAFLLDLSFAGWWLLSVPTLGALNILYSNPYHACAFAQLYLRIRRGYTESRPNACGDFCDALLAGNPGGVQTGEYPARMYHIAESPARRWLSADYHRRYGALNLVLIFFAFSVAGWLWEVAVDLVNTGGFVNRGTLFGPWLPLYGCGGTAVMIIAKHWADRPAAAFAAAAGICGGLEYLTGLLLERVTQAKWWDYSGYFLNVHGRVCLEGVLVFGLGGCLAMYLAAPALDDTLGRLPRRTRMAVCAALLAVFAADLAVSVFSPNRAAAMPL